MESETTPGALTGKRVALGVTGSIAAYKAVSLLRALTRQGANVSVVMTRAATKFVTPMTFEVLSGQSVTTDLFEAHHEMKHLSIPEKADAIVVAPATANFLAKAALGLADDVLSTMLLTSRCPLVVAPAMDGGMWTHPTVQDHVKTLRSRGATILDPEEGPLASGQVAQGRLAAESRILEAIERILLPLADLKGQRILVSAGPTQEAIDPVRYISNRSSGKMGYALAEAASRRGARVTLISGPVNLAQPFGVQRVMVETSGQMRDALATARVDADAIFMAAAVSDYLPRAATSKLKKQGDRPLTLTLDPGPDLLAELGAGRGRELLVGFAAETDDLLANARQKLERKNLDFIVANDVSRGDIGLDADENQVTILGRDGSRHELPKASKLEIAEEILERLLCIEEPA